MVGILWGGGDTPMLSYAKEFFDLFILTDSGDAKSLSVSASARAQEPPLWNFHNI